jgi:hypothetical protein
MNPWLKRNLENYYILAKKPLETSTLNVWGYETNHWIWSIDALKKEMSVLSGAFCVCRQISLIAPNLKKKLSGIKGYKMELGLLSM